MAGLWRTRGREENRTTGRHIRSVGLCCSVRSVRPPTSALEPFVVIFTPIAEKCLTVPLVVARIIEKIIWNNIWLLNTNYSSRLVSLSYHSDDVFKNKNISTKKILNYFICSYVNSQSTIPTIYRPGKLNIRLIQGMFNKLITIFKVLLSTFSLFYEMCPAQYFTSTTA